MGGLQNGILGLYGDPLCSFHWCLDGSSGSPASLCHPRPFPLLASGVIPSGLTPLHPWEIWQPLKTPALLSCFSSGASLQPSRVDLYSQPHVVRLTGVHPHTGLLCRFGVCVCVLISLEYTCFTDCLCCTAKWMGCVFAYTPLFVDFVPFRAPQSVACLCQGDRSSLVICLIRSANSVHMPAPSHPTPTLSRGPCICSLLCVHLCFANKRLGLGDTLVPPSFCT